MNTKAIERVNNYCCEVTQEQWWELVKVADEVRVNVSIKSRASRVCKTYRFAGCLHDFLSLSTGVSDEPIPYPEFLAKLKGAEEWQPKAGEMVEVAICGRWFKSEVIAFHEGQYVCQMPAHIEYIPYPVRHLRPLRPTITREQAEKELNKRIID